MGKLLGQIFKEDIKSTILWFILPPIAMASFMSMIVRLGENAFLQMVAGLSTMLVFLAPAIALIQIVVNDWQRFYGKNASFYSAIPLCAGRITAARIINYILMGIIATVLAFANVLILGAVASEEAFKLSEIVEVFNYIVNYFGGKLTFVIFIYAFLLGVLAVSQVLFSNTLAATKGMNKFGTFGPILTFIVTSFVVNFIFGRVQLAASGDYILANIENTSINIDIASNPPYQALALPMLVNVILIAILVGSSYYIHNKKLSVA